MFFNEEMSHELNQNHMKYGIGFLILVFGIACNADTTNSKSSKNYSYKSDIVQLAKRYNDLGRFSGKILIAENDKIVFDHSFGYANFSTRSEFTDNTSFKIGSLSKIFVQTILARISIEKDIDITDQLSKYLNDYSGKLTLKKLLHDHSSSSKESNRLIADLAEVLTDKSFDELLSELCADLELSNTYFKNHKGTESIGHLYINSGDGLTWNPSPAYDIDSVSINQGIKSTPHDVLSLLQSIEAESIELDDYLASDGYSYSIDKKEGLVILILSNNRHPVGKEISNSIKAIVNDSSYVLPLLRKEISVNSKILREYSGEYKLNDNFNLKVEVNKDSLFTFLGPNKVHLKAQSQTQFFMEDTDAAIRFERDANDRIKGATMLDGFLTGNYIDKIEK